MFISKSDSQLTWERVYLIIKIMWFYGLWHARKSNEMYLYRKHFYIFKWLWESLSFKETIQINSLWKIKFRRGIRIKILKFLYDFSLLCNLKRTPLNIFNNIYKFKKIRKTIKNGINHFTLEKKYIDLRN